MTDAADALTIGALARAADVGVETVRFYQRRGLLPEPARPYGSVRRYGHAAVARLRFVRRSQQLGFSLDEVAELLRLEDGTHCDEARTLAESRLADVRRKLGDLQRIADALDDLVDRCCAAKGKVKCPLITGLQLAAEGLATDPVEQSLPAPVVKRRAVRRG
ncbi:MAG: Hg(II)-responsive transcriptional regulator [Burkholderiaceae bacterium]|nr:Hg(II)-responsive transcriptional regulator [Burkholderiaceae bacterium]